MIQRIQSIYLLIASIVLALILGYPIATMIDAQSESYKYLFYGVVNSSGQIAMQTYPLAILLVALPLISLVNIFLYKNRIRQMRLCIFNILLMLGSVGLIWFYSYQAENTIYTETIFSFPLILPIIASILSYLAFRGIRKDEILVKSMDRIR